MDLSSLASSARSDRAPEAFSRNTRAHPASVSAATCAPRSCPSVDTLAYPRIAIAASVQLHLTFAPAITIPTKGLVSLHRWPARVSKSAGQCKPARPSRLA